MKNIVVLVLFLLGQMSFSQVNRDLGDYNKVKVFDRLNVELIASNENKIVISGDRANDVEVVNTNGELKLRMPLPKLLSGNNIEIKLYYKNLEFIDASEGSVVSSEEVLKQNTIDLNAKEGSEISLELDVKKVVLRAVTGGKIELVGQASNQNSIVASGAILKADNLVTSQTNIYVSSGAEAKIFATLLVDAKAETGGNVTIFGKPKEINKTTSLGGKIKQK